MMAFSAAFWDRLNRFLELKLFYRIIYQVMGNTIYKYKVI